MVIIKSLDLIESKKLDKNYGSKIKMSKKMSCVNDYN